MRVRQTLNGTLHARPALSDIIHRHITENTKRALTYYLKHRPINIAGIWLSQLDEQGTRLWYQGNPPGWDSYPDVVENIVRSANQWGAADVV